MEFHATLVLVDLQVCLTRTRVGVIAALDVGGGLQTSLRARRELRWGPFFVTRYWSDNRLAISWERRGHAVGWIKVLFARKVSLIPLPSRNGSVPYCTAETLSTQVFQLKVIVIKRAT